MTKLYSYTETMEEQYASDTTLGAMADAVVSEVVKAAGVENVEQIDVKIQLITAGKDDQQFFTVTAQTRV